MSAIRQLQLDLGSSDHVSFLHRSHDSGVTLAVKNGEVWNEHNYKKLDAVSRANTMIESLADCYIAQNPIRLGKTRSITNLSALNAFYLDLDTYNTKYAKTADDVLLDNVFLHCEKLGIPKPTIGGSSGRGFQIVWCFSALKPISFLFTWNEIEKSLVNAFQQFGADKNACDAARVLRLSGTINTKNDAIASLGVLSNTVSYESMRAWHNDYKKLHVVKPTLKLVKKTKPKQSGKNIFTLAYGRMKDLEKIAEMRGGLSDGRKLARTIYSQSLSWFYRDDESRERDLQGFINSCFHNPSRYSVRAAKGTLKRYDSDRVKLKNQTIIEWLNITPEEQTHLITIISKDEKNRRKKVKRRERGVRELSIQLAELNSNKKIIAQERKQAALELKNNGLKQAEIANKLGLTERTVRTYLNGKK